jgi:Holliday junction resolvase RusA-like endonuclease
MTDRAQVIVPGCPQAAERARQGRGRWYTPPATVEYRQRVGWAWREAGSPSFGASPLAASLWFYIERPPSHRTAGGALTKRAASLLPPGDVDNYAKGLLDALQKAGAFENDRQVVCLSGVGKAWALQGQARTVIDLWVARPVGVVA